MLLPQEQKILELKYAAKPFGKMSLVELEISSSAVILKIHIITGWVIPEAEFLMLLSDQFVKKMKEGYANVNAEEIEYAFRTYGTTVKDWGKNMNLSLIDEVMIPYLESRANVSKMEEHKKPLEIEQSKNLSEEAYEDWYKQTARQVREESITVDFVPVMVADWMIKKGEIANEEYLLRAAQMIGKRLRDEAMKGPKEYNEFKQMYDKGEFTGKYVKEIEDLSKKVALWNYIILKTK